MCYNKSPKTKFFSISTIVNKGNEDERGVVSSDNLLSGNDHEKRNGRETQG